MPDTRERLTYILEHCTSCKARFLDNVALLTDEDCYCLTDEQVAAVYADMLKMHQQEHVLVH